MERGASPGEAYRAGFGPDLTGIESEYLAYLGWPLLALLLAAAVCWSLSRDPSRGTDGHSTHGRTRVVRA